MIKTLNRKIKGDRVAKDVNAYITIEKPTNRTGLTHIEMLHNGKRSYFNSMSTLKSVLEGEDYVLRALDGTTKRWLEVYDIDSQYVNI